MAEDKDFLCELKVATLIAVVLSVGTGSIPMGITVGFVFLMICTNANLKNPTAKTTASENTVTPSL